MEVFILDQVVPWSIVCEEACHSRHYVSGDVLCIEDFSTELHQSCVVSDMCMSEEETTKSIVFISVIFDDMELVLDVRCRIEEVDFI